MKKNISSHDEEDENQVEKPLLDKTPKVQVKQPKKKVREFIYTLSQPFLRYITNM
jgi:hypothetical protein